MDQWTEWGEWTGNLPALVGEVLGGGEGDSRRDDALGGQGPTPSRPFTHHTHMSRFN